MGWLVVFALRADTGSLMQNIAFWCKNPAMGAAATGLSNGDGAYGHGCSWAVLALMELCQKALFEALEFIQRQCSALMQGKQGL